MISYHVTYQGTNEVGSLTGSITIDKRYPFYNAEQLKETKKFIEDNYAMKDIVITSWTRFERKPLLLILKQLFVQKQKGPTDG